MHYFNRKSVVGTSVWTRYYVWVMLACVLCVCAYVRAYVCVCVRVMFASQEVTHHITQGVWDLALCPYIHFIFSSRAGAVQHLKSFSGKRRVTPRTPAALPLRMESWGAAQARFLWCSTLQLQSHQHQSQGLGIRPRSSPVSLRSRTHTGRDNFTSGSSGLNKANFLTGTPQSLVKQHFA